MDITAASVLDYEPLLRAEAARRWLADYASHMNPSFESAKHQRILCDHLQAVERGDIKRLIIAMPPRHGKTLTMSQYFPSWYFGHHPDHQFILASYGGELAEANSRVVRNLIQDERYPFKTKVAKDSSAVNRWGTSAGGVMIAVGVGGAMTGFGGNCLVAGTKVSTVSGSMNIEYVFGDVMSGNDVLVKAWDRVHERVVLSHVVAAKKVYSKNLVTMVTRQGRVITMTPEHRVYDVDYDRFVDARDVQVGMNVLWDGESSVVVQDPSPRIDRVIRVTQDIDGPMYPVYDIQVEKHENFFANGVLVHNCVVIDDALKGRDEADSETVRSKTWEWYLEVARTRLMPGGAIIVGGTRWHEDDLTGRILNSSTANQWEVLEMPALDDDGNALWPEWFSAETLQGLKEELGSRAWSALYMQSPVPIQGGMFKLEWMNRRHTAEDLESITFRKVTMTVDSSFKTGAANDYSAIAVWGTNGVDYYLLDLWRGKVEFPELLQAIQREYAKKRPDGQRPREVIIEDTAAGQSAMQVLKRSSSIPVMPGKVKESKESRAEVCTPEFEAGKVSLPKHHPLLEDWISEHCSFPTGRHDDFVDTTSAAFKRLKTGYGGSAGMFLKNLNLKIRAS